MRSLSPGNSSWCRARSTDETAALLDRSVSRFGVSRVGSITRLDGVGIATVTAVRSNPIGESVSVCTGKGRTELHARVGALAEALERYCAEPRGRIPIETANANALPGDIVRPEALIPLNAVDDTFQLDWCRARVLRNSAHEGALVRESVTVWVPANAVFFPYHPSPTACSLFAAQTTGLATGSTIEEALTFALLECIERDAYSRAIALASVGRGDEIPVVDPTSAQEVVGNELAAIRARGHGILIRDVTCDTDVPTFLCTIHDGTLAHFGVAARPLASEALRAAVEEAAQSRLTDIQGAREDLPAREAAPLPDPWFLAPGSAAVIPVREGWRADNPGDVLVGLNTRLAALDHPVQPVWVDLSLPEVDFAVVRVVTPGLEVWAYDPTRVGPRAQHWLAPARETGTH